MSLAIPVDYAPMEARLVGEIPDDEEGAEGGWQYEPKWDGFRCLAFRDGKRVELRSKSGQSLTRYFPEVVAALLAVKAERFVVDGELVVPVGEGGIANCGLLNADCGTEGSGVREWTRMDAKGERGRKNVKRKDVRRDSGNDEGRKSNDPSTALRAGPSTALRAGPSTALRAGPSTALRAGPSTALRAGPSTALRAGPSTALRAGPSTALRAGRSIALRAGETGGAGVVAGLGALGGLSFDALLQRIHPAASRVKKLAGETPAVLVCFDLLVDEKGRNLAGAALGVRRGKLEGFGKKYFGGVGVRGRVVLSPATREVGVARGWYAGVGGAGEVLDGVVAKRVGLAYQSGNREGMVKVKRVRTADCVVGGYRYASKGGEVGSLLLGLYDSDGLLHHVGFCSSFNAEERKKLKGMVEPLRGGEGFTGKKPGGVSRWSTERSGEWEAVVPSIVVEVKYDHFTGGRFRHGTGFLRWRPDKAPRACGMGQVGGGGAGDREIGRGGDGGA